MSEESTRPGLSPDADHPTLRAPLKGPSVPQSYMSEESTRPGLSPDTVATREVDHPIEGQITPYVRTLCPLDDPPVQSHLRVPVTFDR